MVYTLFMYSPEIAEEEALHLTERAAWQRILKVSMLHALRWMEALYLSKQAWAERGNAPLNDERYAEWIEWMKAMDENPALLLQTHPHLDEYLLEERIRCFMGGHEALAKLATGAALSK